MLPQMRALTDLAQRIGIYLNETSLGLLKLPDDLLRTVMETACAYDPYHTSFPPSSISPFATWYEQPLLY